MISDPVALAAFIERVLANAPPLSPEKVAYIAPLFPLGQAPMDEDDDEQGSTAA